MPTKWDLDQNKYVCKFKPLEGHPFTVYLTEKPGFWKRMWCRFFFHWKFEDIDSDANQTNRSKSN